MLTLLIGDQEKDVRDTVRSRMQKDNYLVLEAVTSTRLIDILDKHDVDIILIDEALCDKNGVEFTKHIRQKSPVPLFVFSQNTDVSQTLKAYECGANDCILKPFDPDILAAKINVLFSSNTQTPPSNQPAFENKKTPKIIFDDWVCKPELYDLVNSKGQKANLTIREYALLKILVENAGKPVNRHDLSEALKEQNYKPTPRAIDIKIARLRKKICLDPDNPQYIKTIHGIGYMFQPPCE